MSTATTDTAVLDADRYLKEVAPHLASLPTEERSDLLDDLGQHLREIAAEPGPPLAERLGPAEAYAAELLASAGVAAPGRRRPRLSARAATIIRVGRASRVGRELIRIWPVLQAAWWVARGYLAVSLVSAVEGGGSHPGFPVPRLAGNTALGLLGVLVAIPLSVRLGQRRLPRAARVGVVGANVVLAIYALSLLSRAGSPSISYIQSNAGSPAADGQGCLATASGQHITNLYAYGTDGRLLDPVLLYDQTGHPVDNLCPDYDSQGRRLTTQYSQDVNGALVVNAFPRRQSVLTQDSSSLKLGIPNQTDPSQPVKPPAVVVPRLVPTPTTTVAPAG